MILIKREREKCVIEMYKNFHTVLIKNKVNNSDINAWYAVTALKFLILYMHIYRVS